MVNRYNGTAFKHGLKSWLQILIHPPDQLEHPSRHRELVTTLQWVTAVLASRSRYLALGSKKLDVTLVEPKLRYATCFFSNLYLAGLRSFESLTHGYETLAQRYGVKVIQDSAIDIDPVARTVRLKNGAKLAYDRLVVAPGIAFNYGAIDGYDEAATEVRRQRDTMNAQSVWYVAHDGVGIRVQHHDVGLVRDVYPARGTIHDVIVPSACAANRNGFYHLVTGWTGRNCSG